MALGSEPTVTETAIDLPPDPRTAAPLARMASSPLPDRRRQRLPNVGAVVLLDRLALARSPVDRRRPRWRVPRHKRMGTCNAFHCGRCAPRRRTCGRGRRASQSREKMHDGPPHRRCAGSTLTDVRTMQKAAAILAAILLAASSRRSDAPKSSQLFDAIRQGDCRAVQVQLDAGADPNARDDMDATALMKAAAFAPLACLTTLAERGRPN